MRPTWGGGSNGGMRIISLLAAIVLAAGARGAEKYLIEFGWDEPTTGFMRTHIGEMEKTPFDGTVFHIEYTAADGARRSFMGECWGTRAFTDAELQAAVDDLKATEFRRFRQNFLRFNVLPGDVDWFAPEFAAVVHNARQAGRVAKTGRAARILFDIEQYQFQLFEHTKQKHAATKRLEEYAKQAKARGSEVMRGFQDGWKAGEGERRPLVILMTFGYSLPRQQAEGDRAKLAGANYGLLAPFMDGMFEAADADTVVVDGFEFAYGYKEERSYQDARELVFEKLPAFVENKEKYLKHTSLGFGLWMDYDWRNKAWDTKDFSKNHFSPGEFEKTLKMALGFADRYVWVYTEKPRWWTEKGGTEELPAAYAEAVRRAREGAER